MRRKKKHPITIFVCLWPLD